MASAILYNQSENFRKDIKMYQDGEQLYFGIERLYEPGNYLINTPDGDTLEIARNDEPLANTIQKCLDNWAAENNLRGIVIEDIDLEGEEILCTVEA